MSRPALVAVAHGSSHPSATATVTALARQVTRLVPVIDLRLAFVQHAEPSLPSALAAAGRNAVIVPLLLSTGYHLTTDIAAAASPLDGPAWPLAGPLGPDHLLVTALVHRLAEAGAPKDAAVVLAAAGSADPKAAEQVAAQALLLSEELAVPVTVGYAAAGHPSVRTAIACLRVSTGRPVAVASYLLAPGHFHDQLAYSGADWVTAPLGDHPAVAALIIDRYRTAAQPHRPPARRRPAPPPPSAPTTTGVPCCYQDDNGGPPLSLASGPGAGAYGTPALGSRVKPTPARPP